MFLYSYAESRYDVTNINIFVDKSEKKEELCEINDRLGDMSYISMCSLTI